MDRLVAYPHANNLSVSASPVRVYPRGFVSVRRTPFRPGAASARGSIPGIATAQGLRNAQAHGGAEHVLGPGRPTLRLLRQRV